jgi:hypothetical protein
MGGELVIGEAPSAAHGQKAPILDLCHGRKGSVRNKKKSKKKIPGPPEIEAAYQVAVLSETNAIQAVDFRHHFILEE